MREAKHQLYPGCTKFSTFSFVVKLLHMKSIYRISNSTFSAVMKLLAEAFPEWNTLPKSYNEAKSLLKKLGLGYESIQCATIIVRYSERNMPSLTIALFVVCQDGKTQEGRIYHRKCCGIFHWHLG